MIFKLSQAICRFENREELFLTFYDVPAELTPEVLSVLQRYNVRATFFLVANTAAKAEKSVQDILKHGHSIGNHSLDHGYANFFRGKKALKNWITNSENILQKIIGKPTVGFRPPAGVMTPELGQALTELQMPLLHWQTRFYDTRFLWTENKARASLVRARPGDIILLHDRQKPKNRQTFLKTLEAYIVNAKEKGFEFSQI